MSASSSHTLTPRASRDPGPMVTHTDPPSPPLLAGTTRSPSSSSLPSSPPLPPPDFNPPADYSDDSIGTAISAISPPLRSPLPPELVLSPSALQRPTLQAIQPSSFSALSADSSATNSQSSGISNFSESGEHLVDARNDLILSRHASRDGSEEDLDTTVEAGPATVEIPEEPPQAGPSRPRRMSGGESDLHIDLDHAWDSVWPTPETVYRAMNTPTILDPPASGSRFPILAPVSPFITPSFSPAIIPAGSSRAQPLRRPSSPNSARRSGSPRGRFSPQPWHSETFETPMAMGTGRRRSITATTEAPPVFASSSSSPAVNISRHQRSFSNSSSAGSGGSPTARSFMSKQNRRSLTPPSNSPPRSPRRALTGLPDRPGSPAKRQQRKYTAPPLGNSKLSDTTQSWLSISKGSSSSRSPVLPIQEGTSVCSVPGNAPTEDIPPLDTEALPPPVTSAPVLAGPMGGDDGLAIPLPPPLFAPIARPASLRRALSDYEKQAPAPVLPRSTSLTADLERSPPKRPRSTEPDEIRKSPKKSPHTLAPLVVPEVEYAGSVSLVDEGDVLPPEGDLMMDITFEDEGLNTLERIFLLSKSDFGFHRAYIARVLGDLLYDVDPCESVEYVLPLISQFAVDADEGVKEAFAQELHRIMWYFFSVCRITNDGSAAQAAFIEGYAYEDVAEHEDGAEGEVTPAETVTITSEGVQIVLRPIDADDRPPSIDNSDPSTSGSDWTRVNAFEGTDTPDSIVSGATQYDPDAFISTHAEDKGISDIAGPLVDRPSLPANFFTPLLGSLLLNPNAVIAESVRQGLVLIITRLKGKGELNPERWGTRPDVDERRIFATQTGPHSHDIRPQPLPEQSLIERELVEGVVVGMGRLSVDVSEEIFESDMSLAEGQDALQGYAEAHSEFAVHDDSEAAQQAEAKAQAAAEREEFKAQILAEASAGRATSMNLIGSLCDVFLGEDAVRWMFVEEVLRCGDGDVAVRAEGAVALSMLAKIAPVEHVYRLIPLFETLMNDETPQVRQSSCLALPALCRRIESLDYRRSFAIKAVHALTTFNADVRCAALEVLGELIYVFHEDERGPPIELLQVYLDEEDVRRGFGDDWDTVASFNFPGVALTLGADRWSELQPLYHRLNDRAIPKVRRTLAASLHELSTILRPDQVAQDLMPVYQTCITDSDEVRELVFEHVDTFLANLPLDLAWTTYLDLAKAWKEERLGGWRAREQLALHIPRFYTTFHSLMSEEVLEMMQDALLDRFAAVRDAATKGIPDSYEVLGDESDIAKRFRDTLLDLGKSSQFRQRLTFVRCLREFVKPPPNRKAFEDFFLPFLPSLSKDVVDVRLGLAQTVADLFVVGAFYADRVHAPRAIYELAELLAEDEAVDVRDTVSKVNLEHLEENDTVPYEVKPTEPENRAVTLGDLVPEHAPDHPSHDDPSESQTTTSSEAPVSNDQKQASVDGQGNSFYHRMRPVRGQSSDLTRTIGQMRLTPSADSGLLTSGGGQHAPSTPGRRDRGEGDGHWISSPSPSEPSSGMDPFSTSFGQATPETRSPAGSVADLESPRILRERPAESPLRGLFYSQGSSGSRYSQ